MEFKPTRRLIGAAGLAMVAIIVLATAVAWVLPVYVQSRIIPRLAAEFGLAPAEVHVRRIGLWGADLGPIRLDSRTAGVVTLAAVQVDYTPWSLLRGRMEGITLGGLGLTLEAASGRVSLAGWRPPVRKEISRPDGGVPDLATLLPLGLGHLNLLQSQVTVRWNDRLYIIPLEMRLETAALNKGILKGRGRLSIIGNPLTLRFAVNQSANQATLSVAGERFLLETLNRSGLLPEGAASSGILQVTGEAALQLDPVAITGLQVSGRLAGTRLAAGRFVIRNTVSPGGEAQPIAVSITAEDPGRIALSGGPLRIDGPVRIGATSFKGVFSPGRSRWSLNGRLESLIAQQTFDGGWTWEKDLPLSWQVQLGPGKTGGVAFRMTSAVRQQWAVRRDSLRASGDSWDLQCSGRFSARELSADADWTAGPMTLDLPGKGSLKISGVKAGGTLLSALPSNPTASRASARALLSDIRAVSGSLAATLPGIQLQAEGQAEPGSAWKLKGHLILSDGRIQDKIRRIDARGLTVDLPLQWPAPDRAASGRLRVNTLQWQDRRLGGLRGNLRQKGQTVQVRLEHRSKLFDGLRVFMDGSLDAEEFRAEVRVPAYKPDRAVDLGRLLPDAAGIQAGGRLEASGTVSLTDAGLRGWAELAVEQGYVSRPVQEIRLDGIAMTLRMTDIAALKSAPRQRLRVAGLQWGDLKARNLAVDFQLEDRRTLFLEKVGLQWCEGSINMAAVRIFAGREDYDVTLYCDRLDLAMVLEQLGAAEASGDGLVNGRIPLRWTDGRLSFDNGFLYSTPGRSGKIQIRGTQRLLAGIPPGTPQYTQLDIATEALRDYTYQWAKLNVLSEKDKLLLKLQLDGKPNRLLPFVYNPESGQFMRTEDEGQAEFKGIGVDLNFNIPLNEIIHYKDLLNK